MSEFVIKDFNFTPEGRSILSLEKESKDWPVVYMIHNDAQLYVGETQNAYNRFGQHYKNKSRKLLKEIHIIFDDEFNKSAILDIEQMLIQLFGADHKYILQNKNGGQSKKHNYYQREKYLNKVEGIWAELLKKHLAKNSYDDLINSDAFKYSPYNTLTEEQSLICKDIIYEIIDCLRNNKDGTTILEGGAGTGKTIVLINLIFKLINSNKIEIDFSDDEMLTENSKLIHDLNSFIKEYGHELKIGYVVPMTSINKTLKTVFKNTKNGLKASMVLSPFDVLDSEDKYDVIFVDEAHRLAQYKNISFRGAYCKRAKALHKDPKDITQLDMIVMKSKYRVLVYDSNQTVKGSDITKDQLKKALKGSKIHKCILKTQMRCQGGVEYTDYLSKIFDCEQIGKILPENYEFKIFNDVNEMVQKIKELDKKYSLCRNVAGYSWPWNSKGTKSYKDAISKQKTDIVIGPYKYIWNTTNKEFILNKDSVNQIGCIHTLQGYDLNYTGVILGEEIDYDPVHNKIIVDLDKFYDANVKDGCDYETVRRYIINSYKVLLTRGIHGTYVYACNKNMQEYLKRYISVYSDAKS